MTKVTTIDNPLKWKFDYNAFYANDQTENVIYADDVMINNLAFYGSERNLVLDVNTVLNTNRIRVTGFMLTRTRELQSRTRNTARSLVNLIEGWTGEVTDMDPQQSVP